MGAPHHARVGESLFDGRALIAAQRDFADMLRLPLQLARVWLISRICGKTLSTALLGSCLRGIRTSTDHSRSQSMRAPRRRCFSARLSSVRTVRSSYDEKLLPTITRREILAPVRAQNVAIQAEWTVRHEEDGDAIGLAGHAAGPTLVV